MTWPTQSRKTPHGCVTSTNLQTHKLTTTATTTKTKTTSPKHSLGLCNFTFPALSVCMYVETLYVSIVCIHCMYVETFHRMFFMVLLCQNFFEYLVALYFTQIFYHLQLLFLKEWSIKVGLKSIFWIRSPKRSHPFWKIWKKNTFPFCLFLFAFFAFRCCFCFFAWNFYTVCMEWGVQWKNILNICYLTSMYEYI